MTIGGSTVVTVSTMLPLIELFVNIRPIFERERATLLVLLLTASFIVAIGSPH
jgi:hypothetical protein